MKDDLATRAHANASLARAALELFARHGGREACVCAGARNSPLVAALEREPHFRTFPFFDERAAAFFALGRVKADGRPVAVVTTSGTAAAEVLPAMIEAHYSGLALVAITADRPKRYRGTGAPQAIEQAGLFGGYAGAAADWEAASADPPAWDAAAPLHLNVCFEEPLLAGEAEPSQLAPADVAPPRSPAVPSLAPLEDFLASVERPLALVGALAPAEREPVERFLVALGVPVYAEATSGLRASRALEGSLVRSGERLLQRASRAFDGVLRVGGVPTARFWRDLDDSQSGRTALSLSSLPFSGSARVPILQAPLAALAAYRPPRAWDAGAFAELFEEDTRRFERLDTLLEAEPSSEPGIVRALSRRIPDDALVYVGNSLPIREWDLAATPRSRHVVHASRGANGIDGQVSTYLGLCASHPGAWAVLGDLTTLYDLSAPWALAALPDARARLVVVNNRGGRIFERMFRSPAFQNRHALGFQSWAAMWGLAHETWRQVPRELALPSASTVIECVPDDAATARFWKEYDSLWQ